ncbi:alcohol dehydrogenase [Stagonosporopsis vannaccii]|nr:alcohol dehydrogenase [Stagonosporopsis vannaccii]
MSFKLVRSVPRIALGTDKVSGAACVEYIRRGLEAGYRMIDTAQVYNNEEDIGKAIRSSGIPRDQIFVTTKIASGFKKNPSSLEEALNSVQGSIGRLGLGYVDAMLIHHPGDDSFGLSAAFCRRTTWQALEQSVLAGHVKQIGMSNFNASHILEMRRYATISPFANQLEVHPWHQQRELVRFCAKEGIFVQAYAALARNSHAQDAQIQWIALKNNVSTAQVLLRYSLQKGYLPVVKATSVDHLQMNIKVDDFLLSDEDMMALDSRDEGLQGALLPWLVAPDDDRGIYS